MTRAPSNLLTVRKLLLTHLNIDESRVRSQDLEPAEVGIVGDSAHRGGYHCGSDRVVNDDYSVVESPRDRHGLTLDAAALDVGQFEVTVGGRTYDLPHFSAWCVGQCKANAPDSRDIREIIWSPDGRTVKRWDRLGKRSTGDSSHRWHTHISFHRDAIKAGRDLTPLFRRYLSTIGLIEGDDMTPQEHAWLEGIHTALTRLDGREPIGQAYLRLAVGTDHAEGSKPVAHPTLTSLGGQLAAVRADLAALAGRDLVDEQAVAAELAPAVLGQLTPEKIAAAIPETLAKQVADELTRRLAA